MKLLSTLAVFITLTPISINLATPFAASASIWQRVTVVDRGLISDVPQGDDAIRPKPPGTEKPVTPRQSRPPGTDDSVRPEARSGQEDESIRPVAPRARSGNADESIRPVAPGARRTGQNDDGI
jgi:hypothetical protein